MHGFRDSASRVRMRPAAFIDRDGVLNEAVADSLTGLAESPLAVEDVRLLPGVATAARTLAEIGFVLVCVTNQPAAAKGRVSLPQLLAVHERVLELLAGEGVSLEGSLLCPHHPEGVVAQLAGGCYCRKPAPGMLLAGGRALNLDLNASWMLGDTDADVQAGSAAGCRTALIEYAGTGHKRGGQGSPSLVVPDLAEAAATLREEVRA